MSLANIITRAQVGVEAPKVIVEVHLSNGLPAFSIVGLPEASVKEARDRVRSALINSHFIFPEQKITVNLAPADLPKQGGRYDLAIAVGILVASEQIPPTSVKGKEFYGELALSGEVRAIAGILPATIAATRDNSLCYLPIDNDPLAALVEASERKAVSSLQALWLDLTDKKLISKNRVYDVVSEEEVELDMSDVKGQLVAKRVLELAAAGGHNVIFLGPPGTGKSMLAARFPSIMPPLSDTEALESLSVYSLVGKNTSLKNWGKRPFRAPHHTSSAVALVGGSSSPKPGEISLAHKGVLFLDELPEFDRKVIDSLREPMETGQITISRAAQQVEFPAEFQLIAALNPSPTGHHEDKRASPDQVIRYLNKVSGPFVDRVDLQVELPKVSIQALQSEQVGESSKEIRVRVNKAYQYALQRQGKCNARLSAKELEEVCKLGDEERQLLIFAAEKLSLSPRSYHRVIKVSRTIADLDERAEINVTDIKEALSYRSFERLLAELSKV